MKAPYTVECAVHFRRRGRGSRKQLRAGQEPFLPATPGRVPRVARLMALAIHLDGLVRSRQIKNYAAIAEYGHVTRARVTQIMNLLFLAPDIIEEILFLQPVYKGRDPFGERHLRSIAATYCWKQQRAMWRELKRDHGLLN